MKNETLEMQVEKLPESFNGRGDMKEISFTLYRREGNVLMYELDYGNGMVKYEVFNAKLSPKADWSTGKPVAIPNQFKERYPSSNEFGISTKCFAFYSIEKAKEKFILLSIPILE